MDYMRLTTMEELTWAATEGIECGGVSRNDPHVVDVAALEMASICEHESAGDGFRPRVRKRDDRWGWLAYVGVGVSMGVICAYIVGLTGVTPVRPRGDVAARPAVQHSVSIGPSRGDH